MPKLPDSCFDRVAFFYDPLARLVFGNALQEAQRALLPFVPAQSHVLLIGGGSGWLLEQLCLTGKDLQVLYLDSSPRMIRQAQQRFHQLRHNHRVSVSFRTGTEAALEPSDVFDIVFTPFLLDLFPASRLQSLMDRLHASLAPTGSWLFADFWPVGTPPPPWQRALLKSMYFFFRIVCHVQALRLPDFGQQFNRLPVEEVFSKTFYKGMVQAKVFRNNGV